MHFIYRDPTFLHGNTKRDCILPSLSTMVCAEVHNHLIPDDYSCWICTQRGASIAVLCYFWINGVRRAESAGILALVNPLWILLHFLPEPSLSISVRRSMRRADRAHTLPVYTDTNGAGVHTWNKFYPCTTPRPPAASLRRHHPVKQSVTKATGSVIGRHAWFNQEQELIISGQSHAWSQGRDDISVHTRTWSRNRVFVLAGP